jgi:transposase
MNATKKTLPEDIEILKRMIADRDQRLLEKDQRIAALEEFIRLQKLERFSAKSEKSADQVEMFNEAELCDAAEQALIEQEAITATKTKPRRRPLPAELPRVRIEHDIAEHEKLCACGCQRHVIDEVVSEQLDIVPAQIRVLQNVRKKYACPNCEQGVLTAPLPAQPIPKSNASPHLLAHLVVSKYQDALPLYRQEMILARHGIELPRNTLASWIIKVGQLTQPLINLLQDQLNHDPVLHCDETTVQVLKEDGKAAQSKSYMWVRVGGPPTAPVRLFHYADSRRGDVASELLRDYSGYVQTDDYAGYGVACAREEITQLGCWAHARRKFVEAQKANAGKVGKADQAITLIGKLYAVEKSIRHLPPEEKLAARQSQSKALLQKIREWLDKSLSHTLPKGLLGKAMSYMDKNWPKLNVYIEDGRLNIDNNPAENAIRPFVVGRKNWLFSVSVEGANSSANLYSLIETAKANGIEPYKYLCDVFTRLPQAGTLEQMEALLPWRIKLQDGIG